MNVDAIADMSVACAGESAHYSADRSSSCFRSRFASGIAQASGARCLRQVSSECAAWSCACDRLAHSDRFMFQDYRPAHADDDSSRDRDVLCAIQNEGTLQERSVRRETSSVLGAIQDHGLLQEHRVSMEDSCALGSIQDEGARQESNVKRHECSVLGATQDTSSLQECLMKRHESGVLGVIQDEGMLQE